MKILLVLFLLVAVSAQAQITTGTLKVTVVNEHGEEIIGANVGVYQGDKFIKGSATDATGFAMVSNLEPGEYCVEVTYVGYENFKENFKIYSSSISMINCKLKVLNVELSEVVIEKHRKPILGDAYGISSYRSEPSRMPTRSTRSIRTKSKKTRVKKKDTKAEKIETVVAPKTKAGVLTAGEINDFNKFKMWADLSKSEFELYKTNWLMDFSRRIAVVLKNGEDGAVINAKVSLLQSDSNRKIWTAITNNAGRCELWISPFKTKIKNENLKLRIEYAGQLFETEAPVSYNKGINQVKLPVGCYLPKPVDIAFVVDATGSMGDEINYLKDELLNVIEYSKRENPKAQINTAAVFYKDTRDEYLVRLSEFSNDIATTMDFIRDQGYGGGGDTPEAVDTALNTAIGSLKWREETRNKLLFLILDAPPHSDEKSKKNMQRAIQKAAQKGIRIIPVVCSGNDKSNEYLMRSAALATNGTYIFLTDHCGVGDSHIKPTTDEYEVTYLNDLLKEVIVRFTDATSCANDTNIKSNLQKSIIDYVIADKKLKRRYHDSLPQILNIDFTITNNTEKVSFADKKLNVNPINAKKFEVSLSPNPTPGVLQIQMSKKAERVLLLDASGQMLREYKGFSKLFSVNVAEFADGIYFIAFVTESGIVKTERFVLQK